MPCNGLKDEDYASEIRDACRENGLLISAEDDILMLFPALNISRATAERGLDMLEESLSSKRSQLRGTAPRRKDKGSRVGI